MRLPPNGVPEPLPVDMRPWLVGGIRGTRSELRRILGEPHFVETDGTRTCGGEEDAWAWRLPTGQKFLIRLDVVTSTATLYCDPAEIDPVLSELGLTRDHAQVQVIEPWDINDPASWGHPTQEGV